MISKKLKIGIDARLWGETGIGRYIRNLVKGLGEINSENEYVFFVLPKDVDALKSQVKNLKYSIVPTDIKWHSVKEQIEFPRLLNKYNLDLAHFPYFSVPIFYKKPYVLTLHDLILNNFSTGKASTLPYPVFLTKRAGYKIVLRNALSHARRIIVPTESVKKDLEKFYPKIKVPIKVIYEGGFEDSISESKTSIHKKYFIRVGNVYPHKNVERLLEAFKLFKEERRGIKLVLAGKEDHFYKNIVRKVRDLGLQEDVLFYNSPSDQELKALYKGALALVIPSLMEGFSLTAIEAMSCGCPVVASDIPVHREVCKDAVLYCNPNDSRDIKQKLESVLDLSDSEREELIKKGKAQAKEFSWPKMVEETIKVYEGSIGLR